MAIAQAELHTPVLQRGTVDPRLTAKTDGAEEGGLHEHVLGFLEEQVVRAVEVAVEEHEVGTEVPLRRRLPLQVFVGRLQLVVARGEGARVLQVEVVGGRVLTA